MYIHIWIDIKHHRHIIITIALIVAIQKGSCFKHTHFHSLPDLQLFTPFIFLSLSLSLSVEHIIHLFDTTIHIQKSASLTSSRLLGTSLPLFQCMLYNICVCVWCEKTYIFGRKKAFIMIMNMNRNTSIINLSRKQIHCWKNHELRYKKDGEGKKGRYWTCCWMGEKSNREH